MNGLILSILLQEILDEEIQQQSGLIDVLVGLFQNAWPIILILVVGILAWRYLPALMTNKVSEKCAVRQCTNKVKFASMRRSGKMLCPAHSSAEIRGEPLDYN